jgi:putative ABC transport system permease protein
MPRISRSKRLFRLASSPHAAEQMVDDELRFHIDARAEDLIARGMSSGDAHRLALTEFGDVVRYRDDVLTIDHQYARELRMREFAESVWSDVRHAARAMARTPGFLLVTVLTLALGIGSATAIFSVVNGVLLQPLPYPRSDRVVQLFQVDNDGRRMSVSVPNFHDWNAQTRSFSAMALAHPPNTITVTSLREPARAVAADVSGDFFSVFGLHPEIGRVFSADEMRRAPSPLVVVSDAFWRKYLDASPSAIGRTISIEKKLYSVIGVMPPQMDYPAGNELWIPEELSPDELKPGRTSHGWRVVGRLKDGVTAAGAKRDLSSVSRRLKQQYGDATWMADGDLVSLREQLVGKTRTPLLVLFAAAGFLLLIACASVVNLLVARMTLRRSEIGVRLALGATRLQLSQQFLIEAGVLSGLGGLLGVGLAVGGVRLLLAMQTGSLPRANEIRVDWAVLAFAVGVSALAAIVLGLLAVWQGTRGDIRETLSSSQRTQAGSGSGARVRRTLVVSQMALTVVLLIGAGLLARSFLRLLAVDPGFRTQHLVVLDLALPYDDGPDAHQRRVAFHEQVMARLRVIPGVARVGVATGVPLVGDGADGGYLILSRIDQPVTADDWATLRHDPSRSGNADYRVVDGDYFQTMNIPLLRGRLFDSRDQSGSLRVALVSASLAKSKWPNEDAIGKIIEYGNMDNDMRPFAVVGVVGDVRGESLAAEPQPTFYAYEPQSSYAGNPFYVVMQTTGDPASVIASARAVAHELRPDVPPVLRTIESYIAASVADRRFVLALVGVFGGAALVLAMLGIYSVTSYLATQRRREIGVRVALGAQRGDVIGLVVRQGGSLAMIGIVVGAASALLLTRLLKGLVYGVSTTDPLSFVGVIFVLVAVALLASWFPARRATSVNPVDVLRGD